MVPNFGSYAHRKHGRKQSLQPPSASAVYAAAAAASELSYGLHGLAGGVGVAGGNASNHIDITTATATATAISGGGLYTIDVDGGNHAASTTIADMDIDEAVWRVPDGVMGGGGTLKSVSLAGFEDDSALGGNTGGNAGSWWMNCLID